MLIAHLLASPFVGGPEKQILSLAEHLPADYRNVMLSFAEGGKAQPFLAEAARRGFETVELEQNWPHLRRSAREIAGHLVERRADVVCTSGYKPDIVGLWAARRAGIPAIAIAHGWTGATWKVRLNERLDRWAMRRFDCVVSVSEAQAELVARAGVKRSRMVTIPNAVPVDQLRPKSELGRLAVESLFPSTPSVIVAVAGRLSPEKGMEVFIEMAASLASRGLDVGFVLFGDGPLRDLLAGMIGRRGLHGRCILAGFRPDLDALLPNVDVLVLPSFKEGLPVILLEAMASEVPVVATRVGGVPEVVVDGVHGFTVEAGMPAALAARVEQLTVDPALRCAIGQAGRARVQAQFSCSLQSERFRETFDRVVAASCIA